MLHSNNPIIQHKVGLLNLAEELGNDLQDDGMREKLTSF